MQKNNKIHYPFIIKKKKLSKLGIKGNFIDLIKNIHKKFTANIINNVRN